MTRQSASLILVLVVAALCGGCAWIVPTSTQQEWADRLAASENAIKNNRTDMENIAELSKGNQLSLNSALEKWSATDLTAGSDAAFNRGEIERTYQAQVDALNSLRDVGQDLALLRDEIEEGGF